MGKDLRLSEKPQKFSPQTFCCILYITQLLIAMMKELIDESSNTRRHNSVHIGGVNVLFTFTQ